MDPNTRKKMIDEYRENILRDVVEITDRLYDMNLEDERAKLFYDQLITITNLTFNLAHLMSPKEGRSFINSTPNRIARVVYIYTVGLEKFEELAKVLRNEREVHCDNEEGEKKYDPILEDEFDDDDEI